MAQEAITETNILRLHACVDLENIGKIGNSRIAVQKFIYTTKLIKCQPGYVGQYWGHQVEDHSIFVWCINWESMNHHDAFVASEAYDDFLAGFGQVFDLKATVPLIIYTRWTSDPIEPFSSPVTEIALCTLPTRYNQRAKKRIEDSMVEVSRKARAVGKSNGDAMGWVFKDVQDGAKQAMLDTPYGGQITLHAMFGWPNLEDHKMWMDTPEYAEVMEMMEHLIEELGLGPVEVFGRGVFHVKFCGRT